MRRPWTGWSGCRGRRLREELRLLAAHGRVVVGTLPAVDTALDRLLAAPIARGTRGSRSATSTSMQGRLRAQLFRVLLYGAAFMLLAYLGHLFLRLRANARALRRGSASSVRSRRPRPGSSTFRAAVARGDRARAGTAGRAARADRAYVLLDGAEGGPGRERRQSGRAGAEDQGDEVAAAIAAARSPGACAAMPSVAALRRGGLRSALPGARGAAPGCACPCRSRAGPWASSCFEALHRERRWREADIALLRTAGEIFASALERERGEREREALETRLRQAERMEAIGTLAGGIAHDFNNILGAMLGYAEMALARCPRTAGRATMSAR